MSRREQEFIISRKNLLGELPTLYNDYNITFDLMIHNLVGEPWQSIINFTIGGQADQYGDRILAVAFNYQQKQIYVVSAINGNTNMEKYITLRLQLRFWMKFEISQTLDAVNRVRK